ncbi:MAG: cobalt-precorrin-6A reductase [Rhodobacteraceae bacterium]|nr:cobalt-precorrin-6A reductase [Paracoccaceae bacterium]
MTKQPFILILAGTTEARKLIAALLEQLPAARIVASFAGAVSKLPDVEVETRIGGFGGATGMAHYLQSEEVDLVIDATHPYAAIISGNAVIACNKTKVPLLRLVRPEWKADEADQWEHFPNIVALSNALPEGARPFLAIGKKQIGTFLHRSDVSAVVRMIETPEMPVPSSWQLIQSRPLDTVEAEQALFEENNITHLVCKNSGGSRSYAKIEAARALELPVLMIDRPPLAPAESFEEIDELIGKCSELFARDVA